MGQVFKREVVFLKSKTQVIVTLALLTALGVVFTQFPSFRVANFLQISFGYLPVAVACILYGPFPGAAVAGIVDIVSSLIFPMGGAYFPGFTLTAVSAAIIYGLFLHNKELSVWRVAAAVSIVTVFCNIGLNTLWLVILNGITATEAIVPFRIIKNLLLAPLQIGLIYFAWRLLGRIRVYSRS